jgi:SPP1 family predicted phage head-tail adaptor
MVVFFDPGRMTARLDLEAPAPLSDGQGGAVVEWQARSSLWARIEPVSFVVTETGMARIGTVSHRIWIGFRQGVEPGMRFRKGARLFAIGLVRDPDETARYLVCHCEEEKS